MKKLFALLILCLVFAASLQAQESKQDSTRNTYTREFLLNPLSFVVGGFEMGYGFVNAKTNTRIFAGYYFSEAANSYLDYKNMEGFRVEFQHLFLKPVNGGKRFYAGGYAVYKTIRMERDFPSINQDDKVRGSALGVGVILGVRSFVIDNFFFDFSIGGGPNISLDQTHDEIVHIPIVNPYKRGITPKLGLTFGIAF